jgi:chromate transporter
MDAPSTVKKGKECKDRLHILWKLFYSTLYISAFTFGGGFVIVTFMKKKFVDEFHWIDEDEMLDITAMAQSCPGAIAVNAAILVGWKVCGLAGMLTAVAGTIIPPICIITAISIFYDAFASNTYIALILKGMQAAVAAVVMNVVVDMGGKILKNKSLIQILLMTVAFIAAFIFNINVIYIILCACIFGILSSILTIHSKRQI